MCELGASLPLSVVSAFCQSSPTRGTVLPVQQFTGLGLFQLMTLSRTWQSVLTVSDVYLKHICSLDASVFSMLDLVLDDNCAM